MRRLSLVNITMRLKHEVVPKPGLKSGWVLDLMLIRPDNDRSLNKSASNCFVCCPVVNLIGHHSRIIRAIVILVGLITECGGLGVICMTSHANNTWICEEFIL